MTNRHSQFVGYKVYSAQRLLHQALEISLKEYGITPGQWNLLNQLEQHGGMSQKALAEYTHKEQATITRYLDILERKELIVRTRDKNDRRAHIITLTDEAKILLKTIEPTVVCVADTLVDTIDDEEIEIFLDVLARIGANAKAFIEKPSTS